MTQEEKQLVLKTLCSMLPYGVKVQVYDNRYAPVTLTQIDVKKQECIFNFNVPVENCLPYLRPIETMTNEEEEEYELLIDCSDYTYFKTSDKVIDWLNVHHFDYRGLIEKGLALEAPSNMYK